MLFRDDRWLGLKIFLVGFAIALAGFLVAHALFSVGYALVILGWLVGCVGIVMFWFRRGPSDPESPTDHSTSIGRRPRG